MWKAVWKIGGPPKLIHFIWRVCVDALATKGRLFEHHIVEKANCNFCDGSQESIIHVIFHCSLVLDNWSNTPFSHYHSDALTTSFFDLLVWIKSHIYPRPKFA